jgi:hypothetical protein
MSVLGADTLVKFLALLSFQSRFKGLRDRQRHSYHRSRELQPAVFRLFLSAAKRTLNQRRENPVPEVSCSGCLVVAGRYEPAL